MAAGLLCRIRRTKKEKGYDKDNRRIVRKCEEVNGNGSQGLLPDTGFDEKSNKIYVEVKGRDSEEKSFRISRNEIEMAFKSRDNFHIIFVSSVLNNKLRSYKDLGNIFMLDDNEDFSNNKKFRAVNEEYKIIFE